MGVNLEEEKLRGCNTGPMLQMVPVRPKQFAKRGGSLSYGNQESNRNIRKALSRNEHNKGMSHDVTAHRNEWKGRYNDERTRFKTNNPELWKDKAMIKITVKNTGNESKKRPEGNKGLTNRIIRNYEGNFERGASRFRNYPSTSEKEEDYGT